MKEIKLTKDKVALVSDEDYETLSKNKWHASWSGNRFYAARRVTANGKSKILYMHRSIMGDLPGMLVDHSNRDSLDNTRENLRHVTRAQNNTNSAKKSITNRFKGVTYRKARNVWIAQCHNGATSKNEYLGTFKTEEEAYECFRKHHIELNGEHSNEAR